MTYTNSGLTSQRTLSICITKSNCLMSYREITAVCCGNYTKTYRIHGLGKIWIF